MTDAAERREALKAVYEQARTCTACPLHTTRTTVVFGAGNADAELMFVGEGPGANEDRQGLPFVGRAGQLLDTLLAEVGLERADVFICNTVKCRPPGNRDPHPHELESCAHFLHDQVRLVQPSLICTLGNFATKLLRDDPTGITRLHGRDEVRTLGGRTIRLMPLLHPAAALYTPSTLETLRADFARIPELLALEPLAQPEAVVEIETVIEPETAPAADDPSAAETETATAADATPAGEAPTGSPSPPSPPGTDSQLGLF